MTIDPNGIEVFAPTNDTPDINVCPGCGCMELTHPTHQQMFPEKENGPQEATFYPEGYQ